MKTARSCPSLSFRSASRPSFTCGFDARAPKAQALRQAQGGTSGRTEFFGWSFGTYVDRWEPSLLELASHEPRVLHTDEEAQRALCERISHR